MFHFRPHLLPARSPFSALLQRRALLHSQTASLTRRVQPDAGLKRSIDLTRRLYSDFPTYFQHAPTKPRSILRRVLGFSAIALLSTYAGSVLYLTAFDMRVTLDEDAPSQPASNGHMTIDDADDDGLSREIEQHINDHPLTHSLRDDPLFTESRPHEDIPNSIRARNLTAGTLAGTDKIVVPPYVWNEEGGKSLVSIFYLGSDLTGHPGIVHGGMLATILDEGLARCCFPALPNRIGVTANLNINYRSPAPAGSFFVLRATTTKVEGRKAWVKGRIEALPEEGKEPVVLAEAEGLFVEPKNAASMQLLWKPA